MMKTETYFIALQYGQDEKTWDSIALEIEGTPGVSVVAQGGGILEVEVTAPSLRELKSRFDHVCDIEAPIPFEPL